MKKTMAFVLAVLMLVSSFVVTALAATPVKAIVTKELEQLKIDGKLFNEADYPVDKSKKDIQVLAVAEKGFRTLTSSPDFGLYIYIYNPSCIVFDENKDNSVQIGLNFDSNDYSFYGLKLMSRSEDRRFYKYKVIDYGNNAASELYQAQEKVSERVYNIPTVRLSSSNTLTAYPAKNVYIFTGYDTNETLSCSVRDFEVIEVELHDTTWVSPNAGDTISGKEVDKYDHYEVHSVYFAIDSALLNQYDYLSSIRASYEARKLTPIVVTRPGKLSDETISAIENGKHVSGGEDINDLAAIRNYDTLELFYEVDWWYSEKDIDFGNYKAGNRYNQLVYLFENDKIPEDFNFKGVNSMLGFTSDQLRERYYDLVRKGYHSSLLYSESSGVQELDYRAGDMFHLKKYTTEGMSKIAKWWHDLTTKDDSYLKDDFNTECEKIQVIRDPSAYANIAENSYKQYSDELYINECDMAAFKDFCKEAAATDKAVVILRYAVSDYRCVPVYDVWEVGGSLWGLGLDDQVAVSIEKWGYFNVSVAQLGFTTAGVETIIPTCSNVVDSLGDGIIFENSSNTVKDLLPISEDVLDKLRAILVTIMIIVIVIVMIIALPKVIGATKSARTQRRLRNLEKKSDKSKENNNKKE